MNKTENARLYRVCCFLTEEERIRFKERLAEISRSTHIDHTISTWIRKQILIFLDTPLENTQEG